MSFRTSFARWSRPANKTAFVASLPPDAKLFDVGCGNRSAERIKRVQPGIYYVGVDVSDFLQSEASYSAMDRYVRSDSASFATEIANIGEAFDAVISSHNIEHCEDQDAVLDAMCAALKPGGRLYLAFPTEAARNFPSRAGTLNFFDDPTHREVPSFSVIAERLERNGMTINKAIRRSRPWVYAAVGLILEPWSRISKKVDDAGAIWALWGFESIIWAEKGDSKSR